MWSRKTPLNLISGQTLIWWNRASHVKVMGKRGPGRGLCRCKGPEAVMSFVHLRNWKKVRDAAWWSVKRRLEWTKEESRIQIQHPESRFDSKSHGKKLEGFDNRTGLRILKGHFCHWGEKAAELARVEDMRELRWDCGGIKWNSGTRVRCGRIWDYFTGNKIDFVVVWLW